MAQVTVRAWQDEMVETTAMFTVTQQCGKIGWGGTISGLSSGSNYNLTVEVTLVNGSSTITLRTDPAVKAAK
jgi:hypothetical protein